MTAEKEILNQIDAFLFDMDGTLYIEGELIEGAKETLEYLRKIGKGVYFLTNNSSISVKEYAKKLSRLCLTDDIADIVSSSQSTTDYLFERGLTRRVYLVGTESLKEEFIAQGIELVEDEPKTAVLSYDKELTYEKLCKFTRFISKGAHYIATHEDINCPAKDVYLPDIGSFMALIEKSTGKKPEAICGKPRKIMADYISKRLKLPKERIAMVGDRLATDIAFGVYNGLKSILVLSGETTSEDAKKSEIKATLTLPAVRDIKRIYEEN